MKMLVRRGNIVMAACYFRARKDEFLRSIPRRYKSVSSALKDPQRPALVPGCPITHAHARVQLGPVEPGRSH